MIPRAYELVYITTIGAFLLFVAVVGGRDLLLHAGIGCLVGFLLARVHIAWKQRHR